METTINKQEKIKEFANQSPCLCFNLRKAARAITQMYDDMFRDIGLTASQMSILGSLMMIGSLTVSELSEAMATDRTTITRNLKPLEREGHILVKVGSDRRSREIEITKKGEQVASKAFERFQTFKEKVDQSVGSERVNQLCKDLSETISNIQKL